MTAPTRRIDAYHFYERDWAGYDELDDAFEWVIPERFNMAAYCCDRWADDADRVALHVDSPDGDASTLTFGDLRDRADRLATHLADRGVGRGDRVVVHGSQTPEALIAFIAAWKLGGVAVPVSKLLGPDGLGYRLRDSDAAAVVADIDAAAAVRDIDDLPDTVQARLVYGDGDLEPGETAFRDALDGADPGFETVDTRAEDPGCVIYTSGTTGQPKGVVLPHRVLIGHLPQFITVIADMELRDDDVVWTPVEWTWIASIYVRVFPALYYGLPVLAYDRDRFDPESAFALIDEYDVTIIGAAPTALRMMTQVDHEPYDLSSIRVIGGGGESFGESLREWARDVFGDVAIHEGYGQTEANATIGEMTSLKPHRAGKMGVAGIGHDVRIVDPETAEPLPPGEVGEIAVRAEDDPVVFAAYLNRPEATAEKRRQGWHLTHDLATMDGDGYFEFKGRKDDVIISSGYRIGPGEIEDHLGGHPAVADAGVIGVPDDTRGEVPKAFVVLADGYDPDPDLRDELQSHVKENLAKYEYPRALEFVDALPKTTTGKIRRVDLKAREGLDP